MYSLITTDEILATFTNSLTVAERVAGEIATHLHSRGHEHQAVTMSQIGIGLSQMVAAVRDMRSMHDGTSTA